MQETPHMPWSRGVRYPLVAWLFLALILASLSFVNHLCFRTFGLDLGLYTNALYDYAHFRFNDSASFRPAAENLLGDHFDLTLPLSAPFGWIFGAWTLLLVQWFMLLLGAAGCYRFAYARTGRVAYATCLMLVYGLYFGVVGAAGFDYHSNAVAASCLPWFFVGLQERRFRLVWLSFFMILIARENMSLWLLFVCTGATFVYRHRALRRMLWFQSAIAIGWFFLIAGWLMPQLHADGTLSQFRYSVLGEGPLSALQTCLTKPGLVLRTLFTDHLPVPGFKPGIKREFWIIFLLSGAWLLLRAPVFLWMAVPILLQKLLNDQVQVWGVNDHYNVEFAPIVVLGASVVIGGISREPVRRLLIGMLLVGSMAATIRTMDRVSAFVRRENIRLYQAPHWRPVADAAAMREALALIPDDASVSAHTNLHPRVAWRDSALIFPKSEGCRFLLLLRQGNPFPLDSTGYRLWLDSLRQAPEWNVRLDRNGLLLLERKQ